MTDCDRALELISAGLDGALTPEEKDWLEKHLEHCPASGRWTPTLRPCTSSSPPWPQSRRRS